MANINKDTKKHYWLYILKLHQDKYYVGITSQHDPMTRINQHKNGFYSAEWVKKYGFESVIEIIDIGVVSKDDAELLEEKHTVEYMKKFGLQNVRGAQFNYSGKYLKIHKAYYRDIDANAALGLIFIILAFAIVSITK